MRNSRKNIVEGPVVIYSCQKCKYFWRQYSGNDNYCVLNSPPFKIYGLETPDDCIFLLKTIRKDKLNRINKL